MLILSSYSQSWMVIQTIGTSGVAFVVLVASVAAIVSLLPDREAAVDTEGAKTSVSLPYRLGLARPLTLNPRLIGLLAVTLLMIAAVIAVPLTTRGSDAQLASLSVTPTVPGAPGTATPRYLSGGSNISQSPPSSSSGASVGADGSAICGPTTDAETSGGPPTALEGSAKQVASGTIEGKPWSLWSMKGQFGAVGIENGGLVFDGREYGLCPGYPNPSETEMIATNGQAIIYGVVNYPGLAKVQVSTGTIHTFIVGSPLPSPRVQVVNGVSFYIGTLPLPACSYNYLEINTTSPSYSAQHVIGFGGNGAGQGYSISNNPGNSGSCVTSGKLDPLTYSEGQWQLPPGQFNGR